MSYYLSFNFAFFSNSWPENELEDPCPSQAQQQTPNLLYNLISRTGISR